MLAPVSKTIAEMFAFVDFHLYCTEPDSPYVSKERGLIESLRYNRFEVQFQFVVKPKVELPELWSMLSQAPYLPNELIKW